MPAPAVYILAIVGTIAATIAFKELVYEPHIAPKIEQWAEEFIAKRKARRQQRAGAIPIRIPSRSMNNEDASLKRQSKRSDSGDDDGQRQSIELESLVAREVCEWRSEVDRSQTLGLRHRNNANSSRHVLDESANPIPYVPMTPTHVLFDPSLPSTPTSTLPSPGSSPSAHVSSLRNTVSQSTLCSPAPLEPRGRLSTPDPSVRVSAPTSIDSPLHAPAHIPSLSQSYPPDLDYEHGLELLSAPSSRPDSPFSSFSQPLSVQDTPHSSSYYHSFSSPNVTSPLARPSSRSLSDLDLLSDFGEAGGMSHSSAVSVTTPSVPLPKDETGSVSSGSDSSWASAGPHSH